MSFIIEQADRFGLDVSCCAPSEKVESKNMFFVPVNFSCIGTIENILFFLKTIENCQKIITCSDFSLNIQDHKKSSLSGTLKCHELR